MLMGIEELRIPTEEECYRLIREMEMLEHILSHSRLVCRVALYLADRIIEQSYPLNRELIMAAALLHDITKTRSFETEEDHAQTGGKLLDDRGYPEVGRIVGQHVRLEIFDRSGPPTEAEIVNYADKRVLHDEIASLADRMDYIRQRYCRTANHEARYCRLLAEAIALEEKLFRLTGFSPEDLAGGIDERVRRKKRTKGTQRT